MTKHEDAHDNLEDVVEDLDLNADFVEKGKEVKEDEDGDERDPTMEDPEWTNYVMSLLTKKEKVKDKPRAHGLLRIAPVVYSEIVGTTINVHCVERDYAAVTMTIHFDNNNSYTGSAEVSVDNCQEPYNRFPLATATTRALGRALKTSLRLQVLTAEEGNDLAFESDEESEGSKVISDTQLNFIDILCGPKKLNINVVEAVDKIMGAKVESVKKLTHDNSLVIQKTLDDWIKDSSEMPKLGKYDSEWRSNIA